MVLYALDVVDRKVSNILLLLDKDGCDLLEWCSRFLHQQTRQYQWLSKNSTGW